MSGFWRRARWMIGAAVIFIGGGAFLLTKPTPRFSESLSLLKGLKPARTSLFDQQTLLYFGSTSTSARSVFSLPAFRREVYEIDEPFAALNERAKGELKPKAHNASAYPMKNPRMTMYSITNPRTGKDVLVTLQTVSPDSSTITVQ